MAKTPSKSPKKASPQSAETKLVRDLAKILNDTDLSEIEVEKGTLRVRVARQGATLAYAAPSAAPIAAPAPAQAPASPSTPIIDSAAATVDANATKSPMVGTAYIRPSPEAAEFVKVGDSVKAGATILLIEAMKTFNPITAEKAGTLTALYVDDAQPVEFGEPLFVIS